MTQNLGASTIARAQPYIAPPWVEPPTIVIASSKKLTRKKHDNDQTDLRLRVYSNGSDKDGDVTTVVVDAKWAQGKRLRGVDVALTHHEELEELTTRAKRLAKLCRAKANEMSKIYKVYSDN